jgi:hypothetical protein
MPLNCRHISEENAISVAGSVIQNIEQNSCQKKNNTPMVRAIHPRSEKRGQKQEASLIII